MSRVSRAKQELERIIDDPDLIMCYLEIVQAYDAKRGSMENVDPDILVRLFKDEHLGDITNDPEEWLKVSSGMWQSKRNVRVFSDDGGHTHYILPDEDEDKYNEEHLERHTSSPKKGTS